MSTGLPAVLEVETLLMQIRKLPLFVNISKVEFSGQNKPTGDSDEEITLQ